MKNRLYIINTLLIWSEVYWLTSLRNFLSEHILDFEIYDAIHVTYA